jgi:hypothetical protein
MKREERRKGSKGRHDRLSKKETTEHVPRTLREGHTKRHVHMTCKRRGGPKGGGIVMEAGCGGGHFEQLALVDKWVDS